jgi:hypothetical protein
MSKKLDIGIDSTLEEMRSLLSKAFNLIAKFDEVCPYKIFSGYLNPQDTPVSMMINLK